ncbi:Mitochondria protein Fmp29, partial [Penicillium cf. viridicatum]
DTLLLEVYYPLSVCGNRWSVLGSLLCLLPPVITYPLVYQHSVRNSFKIPYDDGSRFNETDRLNERYFVEGGFNKVFLLRAKNGREVIARIPTPIAGPPYYTTASEVATMNFLRSILKLPVPEVLAYSVLSDNPIGAEYILMERVKGESLSLRWLSLTTDETKDIMTQIVDMERKIFDFYFPAYGSLYYKKDLDGET